MKNIRLAFLWKEKWKQSPGIMLITTLLILAILVGMTVGFITINRDNLLLATNAKDQEAALQAAYSGVQYVQMRFEEDGNFGNDLSSSTWTSPIAESPTFTSYEGNGVAVGVLNNGSSVFEVIFNNTLSHLGDGYQLSDIAANPGSGPSSSATFSTNEVSYNNFNSSGSGSPNGTARIVVLGYSHGVTRVVEALLQQKSYINSSVQSGKDINVQIGCSSEATPKGETNMWSMTSATPLMNNIQAGVSYVPKKGFEVTGGSITGSSGSTTGGLGLNQVTFSSSSGVPAGAAYALSGSTGGEVDIGGKKYPADGGSVSTSDGTGTFFANAGSQGNYPTQNIYASNVLAGVGACSSSSPCGLGANGSTVPTINTVYIPAGTWAIESDKGKGDIVDVYSNTTGNVIARFQGTVNGPNGSPAFTVSNFKIQVQPGVNLVVDDNYPSDPTRKRPCTAADYPIATSLTSKVFTQAAEGNLMLTLSPLQFPSTNTSIGGNASGVLPTFALDYSGNSMGTESSSLVLGGNLYIQGALVGSGSVVAESQSSESSSGSDTVTATASPSDWLLGGGGKGIESNPDFKSGSWTRNVYCSSGCTATTSSTTANQAAPPSGDYGDIYVEGNSELSSSTTGSIAVYAGGNVGFNPIPSTFSGSTQMPLAAFTNAMDELAGGTDENTPQTGPAGNFGWANNTKNNTLMTSGGDSLDPLNSFSWDLTTNDKGNPSLTDSQRHLLRGAFYCTSNCDGRHSHSPSNSSVGGHTGLENFPTNYTPSQLISSSTTLSLVDGDLGITSGTNLNLFKFVQIENYLQTNNPIWLTYTPDSGRDSGNPVEQSIINNISKINNSAANMSVTPPNQSSLGYYLYSKYPPCTTCSATASVPAQREDMYFHGLIYVKGAVGIQANAGCYTFSSDGALVTTSGSVNITNAGDVDFIYDPSQIESFAPTVSGGYVTQILWMTVW